MPTPEERLATIVEDLIEDIKEQKCILLIGPEIIQIEGKSLIRHVHEEVLKTHAADILLYYEQDSLFLFQNEKAKFSVSRQLKRLYQNLEFNSDIYRKILELPFHVVISLNPDTYLCDAASGAQYGVPNHFHFFMSNGETNDEVPEPDKNTPLFYNLTGCIADDESLILDYEDLFQLLRTALGPDGLPTNLRKKLKDARSFLFLGFDFSKWYTQLLLQLLTGDRKGRQKFAINTQIASSDARDFLLHQFSVEFLGSEQLLFNELYDRAQAEKILRKIKQPMAFDKEAISKLKSMVGENRIEEVLETLERLTIGSEYHDWLISIKRRYKDLQQQQMKGTLRPWEADEFNRIADDLLKLITQIQQDLP